jgi:hypothetical protein
MSGRYGDIDYPTLTKRAVLACAAVFLLALAVEGVAAATGTTLPAWERTLLVDVELLAAVGVFLSAFVFGVALPLTE